MTVKQPNSVQELLQWEWSDLEPAFQELQNQSLTRVNVNAWLSDWSSVKELAEEMYDRLYVATTVNTADKDAETRFHTYMEKIYPNLMEAEQKLKEKLLSSQLEPEGFEMPLRRMQVEAEIFRSENLPLLIEEEKINNEHDKVMGAQTVTWKTEEKTARQMLAVLSEPERTLRADAWQVLSTRQLADREVINTQWQRYMKARLQMSKNADQPDYRTFRWQQMTRFDYTPADCKSFHRAIEEVVVPVVARLAKRRCERLGIQTLRYYDIFVDPTGLPRLKPFEDVTQLINTATSIFKKVHPRLGGYFGQMNREGLLDLENRKHKAAGGYCTSFAWSRRPFIFSNAVGIHEDVQTVLHEGGHCFNDFESYALPYIQQRHPPMEFAEVASMGMEYLCMAFLSKEEGGFYSSRDATRAQIEFHEEGLRFWPYMALVDAFQHWVYENPQLALEPANCDACWEKLERRFRPYLDWSGEEEVMRTGWQRKDHIHQVPFYYVEYGLAQLGAAQIWLNFQKDRTNAVESYLKALALGGSVPLPDLYRTAGAKLAFDAATLRQAVEAMEKKIQELEASI